MRADRVLHLIKGNGTAMAPVAGRTTERRDLRRRAQITERLFSTVVADPYSAVTVDVLRDGLDVPPDAAKRLLLKLARAGILEKSDNGVWVRTNRDADRTLVL